MKSRRDFLQGTLVAGVAPFVSRFGAGQSQTPVAGAMFNLRRPPDSVVVQTSGPDRSLKLGREGRWEDGDLAVITSMVDTALRVELSSPGAPVRRIRLRWNGSLDTVKQIVGDAWERGYGDLEWRGFVPDRVMPWYFATSDGRVTNAYGVRTSPNAFCFWQVDPQGITLLTDVRSGGAGVELGKRVLPVCDIVTRQGKPNESAFAALREFCKQMAVAKAVAPKQPVYGSNDWYWAYGKNSADSILGDAKRIVELSPTGSNRPFVVIDDGWQPERGQAKTVGSWEKGNEKFPDMPDLARKIKEAGAKPGIWIRPLQATANAPDYIRLPRDRAILDPTAPPTLKKISDDVARLRGWGYELIKHDYSTFDILGRWGSTMGEALTRDGWTFAEGPKRTTAEVITELYTTIRHAAGDDLIIGCNTVSHLTAGLADICRIGDDTSGREWARTRKMGVNTLAFRGAQHGAFYVADADCVGVTTAIPWALNRQWLDLLARSGTMLFVSLAPDALGDAEKLDLKAALAFAAKSQSLAEPLDWMQTSSPSRWKLMGKETVYDWNG